MIGFPAEFDMFTRKEDLCDELRAHVYERGDIAVLSHPLVVDSPFFDNGMCARQNMQLAFKRAALAKAEAEGDWHGYVFTHERPYRFSALMDLVTDHEIDRTYDAFWPLVGEVWTDSENIHQHLDEWSDLWSSSPGSSLGAMVEEDRAFYDALPDTITLYRGWNSEGSPNGLSWTTDYERAMFFARRYKHPDADSMVTHGTAHKADVFAAFVGRGESEVVIDPNFITITKEESL